jgi:hypothetical protein
VELLSPAARVPLVEDEVEDVEHAAQPHALLFGCRPLERGAG